MHCVIGTILYYIWWLELGTTHCYHDCKKEENFNSILMHLLKLMYYIKLKIVMKKILRENLIQFSLKMM